jgi:hypothetical protein
MISRKRTKKQQLVEKGAVLCKYEDNATNKLEKEKFVMGQGRI